MKRMGWICALAILAMGVVGCGKSDKAAATASITTDGSSTGEGGTAAAPKGSGPDAAVYEFLEAVRTGADEKASKMLTPLARQKVAEQHMVVAPPGSDTAKFQVGQVQMLSDEGARVTVKWTDLNENGQPRTDEVIWMVRKVTDGWRIAGVAAPVFEGEPPLILNFEDPEDMLRKQQMVRDEIRRRMEAEKQQIEQTSAQQPAAPAKPSAPPQAQRPATPAAPVQR
jgi:hypothetical protein